MRKPENDMDFASGIESLPLELGYKLFERMDPKSLLLLSQTCTSLRAALSDRHIWISALHCICTEHHIFAPSYPTASMHLHTLQHAALGPLLWETTTRRMSSRNRTSLVRDIGEHQIMPWSENGLGERLDLVPGGRFLLRRAEELGGESVMLYDLGGGGRREGPPLVDTITVTTGSLVNYGFGYSCGSTRLRVIVQYLQVNTPQSQWYQVYEIDLNNSEPSGRPPPRFRPIAKISLDSPDSELTTAILLGISSNNLAIIRTHKAVIIWDFLKGRCATWKVDSPPTPSVTNLAVSACCTENTYVDIVRAELGTSTTLSLWNVPILEPFQGPHLPLDEAALRLAAEATSAASSTSPVRISSDSLYLQVRASDRETRVEPRFLHTGYGFNHPANKTLLCPNGSFTNTTITPYSVGNPRHIQLTRTRLTQALPKVEEEASNEEELANTYSSCSWQHDSSILLGLRVPPEWSIRNVPPVLPTLFCPVSGRLVGVQRAFSVESEWVIYWVDLYADFMPDQLK